MYLITLLFVSIKKVIDNQYFTENIAFSGRQRYKMLD